MFYVFILHKKNFCAPWIHVLTVTAKVGCINNMHQINPSDFRAPDVQMPPDRQQSSSQSQQWAPHCVPGPKRTCERTSINSFSVCPRNICLKWRHERPVQSGNSRHITTKHDGNSLHWYDAVKHIKTAASTWKWAYDMVERVDFEISAALFVWFLTLNIFAIDWRNWDS